MDLVTSGQGRGVADIVLHIRVVSAKVVLHRARGTGLTIQPDPGRQGHAEDIAAMAVYLSDDAACLFG